MADSAEPSPSSGVAGMSLPSGPGVGGDIGGGPGRDANLPEIRKLKKKKLLLMGKSGSGKSSMRSIVFSNYLAKDTRRLGATIDIDLSHVKFLGNLHINLWDCGGQEAFIDNYLSQQRAHVFSNVGVLIYVFDVESHDKERDLATYVNIITALAQFSQNAKVVILFHKMDLIKPNLRSQTFNERANIVQKKTSECLASIGSTAIIGGGDNIDMFATSIWDQSLYKAWAAIIHDLVPNLAVIEKNLDYLGIAIQAEEIILFERVSFLAVSTWTGLGGQPNPYKDRFERVSNILKTFKHACAKYTGTPRNAEQIKAFELKGGLLFNAFILKFTANTYILVVLPPGEARFNAAELNTRIAAEWFKFLDAPSLPAGTVAATLSPVSGLPADASSTNFPYSGARSAAAEHA